MTKPTGKGRGRSPAGAAERDKMLAMFGGARALVRVRLQAANPGVALTQRIVAAAGLPPCSPSSERFKNLRHKFGRALTSLLRDPGPTRDERLRRLKEIEQTARKLRDLIKGNVKGRPAWGDLTYDVDTRVQRAIEKALGPEVSGPEMFRVDGLLLYDYFVKAAQATALLAQVGHARVKANAAQGHYDRLVTTAGEVLPVEPSRDEFFEWLALAHAEYANNKNVDSFIRFVRAVSAEFKLNIPDSAVAGWCRASLAK